MNEQQKLNARVANGSLKTSLSEGWVSLTIQYEPGDFPEEVAFGPPHLMKRLKKWLDHHFEMLLEQRPLNDTEIDFFIGPAKGNLLDFFFSK